MKHEYVLPSGEVVQIQIPTDQDEAHIQAVCLDAVTLSNPATPEELYDRLQDMVNSAGQAADRILFKIVPLKLT